MATQRIKGQECKLAFVTPDGPAEGIDAIKSFEANLDMEILSERYIGEDVDRFDDVVRGFSGKAEIHLASKEYFRFQQKVQDRAQRRTPAAGVFNVTSTFNFPNGERARITFQGLSFEGLPMSVPDGAQYVSATISWKCSTCRRVL